MVQTDTGSWRVIWALPAPVAVRAATGFLAPRVPSGRALPPRPARAVRRGQARPASRPGGLGHLDGLRQYLLGPGRLAAAAQEAAVAVQGLGVLDRQVNLLVPARR